MNIRILLFSILITVFSFSYSQSIKNIIIDVADNGKPLSDYLKEIEEKYQVDFIFQKERIEPLTISRVSEQKRLESYLKDFFVAYGLSLVRVSDKVAFIVDKKIESEFGQIKRNYVSVKSPISKGNYSLSGTVIDGEFDEPVIGAQVYIPLLNIGTLTDINGKFSILVPQGIHKIEIRNVGLETSSFIIGNSIYGEVTQVNSTLFSSVTELQELVVSASREDANIMQAQVGVEVMSAASIKSMPTFLGEVDPIRSISALPGVSTVGEVSSGFNVRGGESGQNLILQDGAVIFNPTHLFGLFSAFNPDLISDVELHKGAGGAGYGGRVSSILDIKLRNGDMNKHLLSGGVGLISSHLTSEGPIIKGTTSYILGARYSYSNWLLKAVDNRDLNRSNAGFYDVTGKILHKINEKNYLSVSGYFSHDDFKLVGDSSYEWSTINATLKWDHTFTPSLFSTMSLRHSHYQSSVFNDNLVEGSTYNNGVLEMGLKYDFLYKYSESMNWNWGVDIAGFVIDPGKITPAINSIVEPAVITEKRILQPSIYIENDWSIIEKLGVKVGLRYSQYYRIGTDQNYIFDFQNFDGRYPSISDTVSYQTGELVSFYHALEPRFVLRYSLNDFSSLKMGYNRSAQYIHLMSNSTATTPNDYWMPSGKYLKPLLADQFSFGYFMNTAEKGYEISGEVFYKNISNTVDYIDGADMTVNTALESGLLQGKGISYGLEVFLKKNEGAFTGWVAYTYSRSLRKFGFDEVGRTINNGNYYPSIFDQPHNLSLVFTYKLNDRVSFSSNFKYSTGRVITIPISKFSYDPYLAVLNYSERNEYRIPDYHRLDLSMTVKERKLKDRHYSGEWVFSAFNVYARKNPYSIFFNQYGRASQLTILGSLFPSITYNFKF
jgi:hypothetical protein